MRGQWPRWQPLRPVGALAPPENRLLPGRLSPRNHGTDAEGHGVRAGLQFGKLVQRGGSVVQAPGADFLKAMARKALRLGGLHSAARRKA